MIKFICTKRHQVDYQRSIDCLFFFLLLVNIGATLSDTGPTGNEDLISVENFNRNKHLLHNMSQMEILKKPVQQVELDEYLRFRVKEQLNQIEYILSDILLISDTDDDNKTSGGPLYRVDRTSPLGRREQCTISLDKLKSLKLEFNSSKVNYQELHCTMDESKSDNCKELLKFIQCSVKNLKLSWEAVSKTGSTQEVAKWKNAYFTLKENYQKEIENIKNSVTQKYAQKFDRLINSLHDLKRLLQTTLEDLRESNSINCIYEIVLGKYEKALITFDSLKDTNSLKQIIQTAFSEHGKLDQLPNIWMFIQGLKDCSHQKVAYITLHDLMKNVESHYTKEAHCLSKVIKECTTDTPMGDDQFFSNLQVVKKQTNNYDNIKEILKKYSPACENWANKYCEFFLCSCPVLGLLSNLVLMPNLGGFGGG